MSTAVAIKVISWLYTKKYKVPFCLSQKCKDREQNQSLSLYTAIEKSRPSRNIKHT